MCILAMVLCLERSTLSQAAQFKLIMEICKVPTLRLKTLNKHSITHIMYIKMEMLSAIEMYIRKKKKLTHNV